MRNLNKIKKSRMSLALALFSMVPQAMSATAKNESIKESSLTSLVDSSDIGSSSTDSSLKSTNSSTSDDHDMVLDNEKFDFSDDDLDLIYDDLASTEDITVSDDDIKQVHDKLVEYAKKRQSAISPILQKFYKMQEDIIAAKNQPTKQQILAKNLKILAKRYLPRFAAGTVLSWVAWRLAKAGYNRIWHGIPMKNGIPLWDSFFAYRFTDEGVLNEYLTRIMLNNVGEIDKRSSMSMKPIETEGTNIEFGTNETIRSIYVPGDLTPREQQTYFNSYKKPNEEDDGQIDLDGVKNAVILVGKGRKIAIKNINNLKRILIFCEKESQITFEGNTSNLEYIELASEDEMNIVNLQKSKKYAIKCKQLNIAKNNNSKFYNVSGLNSWTSSGRSVAMRALEGIIDKNAKIKGYIGQGNHMYIYNSNN